MAKRISQLTALVSPNIAQDDKIPIVDTSAGQTKYVTVKDLVSIPDYGWSAAGETWTYSAWDSTNRLATITVPTDATTKYSVGMYVRFSQSTGGVKYGRITSVAATTLIVYVGSAYTLNNEAISGSVYSSGNQPYGLPQSVRQNEVSADMLATNAIKLGYAQITGSVSTTSATYVQATGLSVTFTVPSGGRTVKSTVYARNINNAAGRNNNLALWDGVVASGTQLQEAFGLNQTAGTQFGETVCLVHVSTPASGSKTYNVGIHSDGTGTMSIDCAATAPAFLLIETI